MTIKKEYCQTHFHKEVSRGTYSQCIHDYPKILSKINEKPDQPKLPTSRESNPVHRVAYTNHRGNKYLCQHMDKITTAEYVELAILSPFNSHVS